MSINKNKRFLEDYDYRIYRIKHLGKKHGWNFLSEEDELIFGNNEAMLRIDAVELTVQTELLHPKKGDTKLFRHGDFSMDLIEKIFRNPRAHMPEKIESQYLPKEKKC